MNLQLQKAKTLVNQHRFEEAFEAYSALLAENESNIDNTVEIFRAKAEAYVTFGDYAKAVEDIENVFDFNRGIISDYFLAANWALHISEYAKATIWFLKVLEIGDTENNEWFKASIFFYLAYIEMQEGNFEKALQWTRARNGMDDSNKLPIPEVGMVSLEQLRKEILRRTNL